MERALELKVGAVLLMALLVLGGFVLLLGDVSFQRGTRIYVDYVFSGPIQAGAPVKISGVKVGRVERLEFLGGVQNAAGEPIQVRLVLRIEDRAEPALREGARFYINTQGLLGEHYVEVVPAARPGPPIAADAIVRGEDPPRFDLLVQRIYQLLEAASKLLEGDRGELGDLIRSGASLAKTLDRTIAASQDDLVRAIAGAAVAAEEGSALMRSLNHAVGDGTTVAKAVDDLGATAAVVRRELPPALDKLQRSLDQLNRLGESLDQVPPDQIAKLLKSAVSAADNAERVLADARTITERVRAGGGTIGLLLSDDEIYDDLKELLRDLKQHPWKLVWKQ